MAMPFLNYDTETPLNFEKFKTNPKKSNLKSFWAFLITVFIYISVFYVFNLSPSALFCTTKFWFIISNTLILIIATDFTSFSSSKDHDYYHEYDRNNNVIAPKSTTNVPSFEFSYVGIRESKLPKPQKEQFDIHEELTHEKIISVVASVADHINNQQSHENDEKSEIFVTNEKEDVDQAADERINGKFKKIAKKRQVKTRVAKCIRTNSDKAILTAVAAEAEKYDEKIVLRRTFSERYEEPPPRIDEDEFSTMSNEELNRRVEEFIRNFNRQIRLQAAQSRQNVEPLDRI